MALSVFDDKTKEPTLSELREVLGETAPLLNEIEEHIKREYGELTHEWKYYSKKAGWTLSLIHKRRKVLGLIPDKGGFAVGFVLGKRAVAAARESALPPEILLAIEDAREYVEGRSFRFDITAPADVETVKKLITIKMAK
jgi:hypothetical protein